MVLCNLIIIIRNFISAKNRKMIVVLLQIASLAFSIVFTNAMQKADNDNYGKNLDKLFNDMFG